MNDDTPEVIKEGLKGFWFWNMGIFFFGEKGIDIIQIYFNYLFQKIIGNAEIINVQETSI